jgi:hypothetical protein
MNYIKKNISKVGNRSKHGKNCLQYLDKDMQKLRVWLNKQ